MKKIALILAAVVLAGCAAIVKVEGEHVVNNRLAVKVGEAWNRLTMAGGQPYETWTQEGPSLDQLRFWAAIQPGQALMAATASTPVGQKAPRVPTFTSGMAPDQLVNLFEILYSADGSQVKMTRMEPAPFAGELGVRFEFAVTRKRDDLQFRGVGWVAVRKNELFAATFLAPQLAYYQRLMPKVETVIATARIRS